MRILQLRNEETRFKISNKQYVFSRTRKLNVKDERGEKNDANCF